MKLRYIFAIVMLWSLNCFAQEGASAYSFLEVPSSSHAFALGGTNITVIDDDINLMEQNPALLGP